MAQFPLLHGNVQQPINSQYNDKIVGFDVRNKDSIPSRYICQKCKFLLRNPLQLQCGHRFCQSCFDMEKQTIIICSICNLVTSRDKILFDRGCQQDMESLEIVCSSCDWNGLFKDYSQHLSTNHRQLICEYCGEKFDTMNIYTNHQSECAKMLINCRLKSYGCTEQFIRMNTRNHLLSIQHQATMANILRQTKSDQITIDDNQEVKSLEMDWDSSPTTTSNSRVPIERLKETIDVLSDGIQVLNDDTLNLHSEIIRNQNSLENLSEYLSKLKWSTEETNKCHEGLQPNQQFLQQEFDSLKQKLEDQQANSYDGTLIWTITNVQKKMSDAQSERQTSIYSPVFYSSHGGYKMCARLYFYGDGNARGTHMSLFFVLMRGEYDAILQFPFNYKITFCLYDQTSQQRHIIDSFRPDTKSNSFQRPRLEMNTASGIPKFFPLSVLRQDNNPYIRNDTMFIKIIVHFNETPKMVLPYIFTINPGLTPAVQQLMIKHEIDRQAEQQKEQTKLTDTSTTTSVKDESI